MKNEIPPSTTTAPMAMNSALPLLNVLPPVVLAEEFWMTVGVALVAEVPGDAGIPGDSGLLLLPGSGVTGAVVVVAAAATADALNGTINVADSATAAKRPRTVYRSEASGRSIAGVSGVLR